MVQWTWMHPEPHSDLTQELRQRIQRLERNGAWEIGLATAVAAALVGMLYCALNEDQFHIALHAPGALFFGALLLLLLLAWLARDRSKRVLVAEFETLVEVVQRHYRTEQALRDPLTGLYNKAGLGEFSPGYLKRAERSAALLGLLVLDLDNLHELNNKFGHMAGDTALVEFAHSLKSSTRGSDLVARYGGDEFVVLLDQTSALGSEAVIGRLRERLEARNASLSPDQVPLSFTAGAAVFQQGMDFSALFKEADGDLLRRKRVGRSWREAKGERPVPT